MVKRRKIEPEQIEVAKKILANRLQEFPPSMVKPLMEFVDGLVRRDDDISRKFIMADIGYLIEQHDDPAQMDRVAAQFLYTVEEIRQVLLGIRVDDGQPPTDVHWLKELGLERKPGNTVDHEREEG